MQGCVIGSDKHLSEKGIDEDDVGPVSKPQLRISQFSDG
jgi:hypothetical protein